MTTNRYEIFARKFPDLMKKARFRDFECGEGWDNIINVLCELISSHVNSLRIRIAYNEQQGKYDSKLIEELLEAIDHLPVIAQIKEKFGGLRFYVDNGPHEVTKLRVDSYIIFAERMADVTCEVCGNAGGRRSSDWFRTLCESHHREREVERVAQESRRHTNRLKLSDE